MRLDGSPRIGGGVNELKINEDGELLAFSIVEDQFEHVSDSDGKGYNWSSEIIDIDDGDTILLLKNTSSTDDLHIESIMINCGSTASQFQVHIPAAEVTTTGTTVTGTNLNTGSNNVADAEAKSDETNNSQGNIVFSPMLSADSNISINSRGLILSKNKSVAIDVTTAGTEVGATIRGFFRPQV